MRKEWNDGSLKHCAKEVKNHRILVNPRQINENLYIVIRVAEISVSFIKYTTSLVKSLVCTFLDR